MKKKFNKTIIAAVMAVILITALAFAVNATESKATGIEGDYMYSVTDDGQYAVIEKYIGSDEKVIIPEMINNLPVKVIGDSSFQDNTTVTDVIIPDTVELIDEDAFLKCTALSTVRFSKKLKEIRNSAFKNTSIERLVLPDSLTKVGWHVFEGNKALIYAKTPENLSAIGNDMFSYCNNLKEVDIPDTVTDIGSSAFAKCTSLEYIKLPKSLKSIGALAFSLCENLKSVEIPYGTSTIGMRTFQGCFALKNIKIPDTVTYISYRMFYCCENLEEINIPESVTSIGSSAFKDCKKIDKIVLPSKLTSLCGEVFSGTAITEIILPDTLETLYADAFKGSLISEVVVPENVKLCFDDVKTLIQTENIKKITFKGNIDLKDSEVQEGSAGILLNVEETPDLHYADTIIFHQNLPISIFDTKTDTPAYVNYYYRVSQDDNSGIWTLTRKDSTDAPTAYTDGLFEYIFDTNGNATISRYLGSEDITQVTVPHYFTLNEINHPVTKIGIEAFRGRSELTRIIIPDSVKSIAPMAFSFCNSLNSIVLPQGLEKISEGAFMNSAISEIILPPSVKAIKTCAFTNAEINSINLENVEEIESFAFYSSTLSSVIFGNKIDCIGSYAFYKTSLTSITIGNNVKNIETYAFYSTPLVSVSLGNSLETIGDYAFAYTEIEGILLPDSLKENGKGVFYRCKNLKTITIPPNIDKISDSLFAYCYSLTEVKLNGKEKSIGDGAFANCKALESFIIPDHIELMGKSAFAHCENLAYVKISKNISKIEDEAFYYCEMLSKVEWDAPEKVIGRYAFAECGSLYEFDFTNVKTIYYNSFYMSDIWYADIGITYPSDDNLDQVVAIPQQAFKGCDKLETVSIGNNVEAIESEAFASCPNLNTVMISDNVTSIADDAFNGSPNVNIICSENSYALAYANANGISVTTLVIQAIPNQVYSGYPIKPAINVTLGGASLSNGSDYSADYSNNLNVGTASVKITGKGDYKYLASAASFTIVTKSIKSVSIGDIADCKYTGKAVKPTLNISYNGKVLREGTDYKVSYYNNVDIGRATAYIVGIGNFSSTETVYFNISDTVSSNAIMNFIISLINSFLAWIESVFIVL